jgi:SAM-dependent methyltransferase
MKDLFSEQSASYLKARPSYSEEIIGQILLSVPERDMAWDAGAGSGQFTQLLAPHFNHVLATDISENQLQHAPPFNNVRYAVKAAAHSGLMAHVVDLVTVAQAIHWFDFEAFYKEVRRLLKPDGVLAVIGYGLIQIHDQHLNAKVQHLYHYTLKSYWDPERRYIDELYQTIPFPFDEIATPQLELNYVWTAQQLFEYLTTWSAVQYYERKTGHSALTEIADDLRAHSDTSISVTFPVLLRLGKLKQY